MGVKFSHFCKSTAKCFLCFYQNNLLFILFNGRQGEGIGGGMHIDPDMSAVHLQDVQQLVIGRQGGGVGGGMHIDPDMSAVHLQDVQQLVIDRQGEGVGGGMFYLLCFYSSPILYLILYSKQELPMLLLQLRLHLRFLQYMILFSKQELPLLL